MPTRSSRTSGWRNHLAQQSSEVKADKPADVADRQARGHHARFISRPDGAIAARDPDQGSVLNRFLEEVKDAAVQWCRSGMSEPCRCARASSAISVHRRARGAWRLERGAEPHGHRRASHSVRELRLGRRRSGHERKPEREDSAALFAISRRRARAHQLAAHRTRFDQAFDRAAHNITEPGEADVVRAIHQGRDEYTRRVRSLHGRAAGNLARGRDRDIFPRPRAALRPRPRRVRSPARVSIRRRCCRNPRRARRRPAARCV